MKNPFPLIASLWARMAELAITALFVALALTASLLFEELGNRANEMNEESNVGPLKLENWRRTYVQVCEFVAIINQIFGFILLIKTALAFAISIFELNKILQTRMEWPQYYFEFVHTALRFLLEMLLPSYLLTQKVFLSFGVWLLQKNVDVFFVLNYVCFLDGWIRCRYLSNDLFKKSRRSATPSRQKHY